MNEPTDRQTMRKYPTLKTFGTNTQSLRWTNKRTKKLTDKVKCTKDQDRYLVLDIKLLKIKPSQMKRKKYFSETISPQKASIKKLPSKFSIDSYKS